MSGASQDGWQILERAGELAREGEEFALATVVWRQGPSSGKAGSRAIITATGEVYGWIGGACAEPAVIREARRAIERRESLLLLLGTAAQFGDSVPDGMDVVPIACHSEGALQVFIEPVVPTVQLVVVGRSPMTHTLADLAAALGWSADVRDGDAFATADVGPRSIVIIATQGHGDEEAVELAVAAEPAFVGLVASRKRAEAVLGYLADRGVPRDRLEKVRAPVGLDLGHTSHREIAVSILAELVQLRASGGLSSESSRGSPAASAAAPAEAVDPVCGMTVVADSTSRPFDFGGATYYFCSAGCRAEFERDPERYGVGGLASKEA